MDNKAFEAYVKNRSIAEGGYSDQFVEPEDPAHANSKDITVRGFTTTAFKEFLKSQGFGNIKDDVVLGMQISMLRGANEPKKIAPFYVRDKNGNNVILTATETDLKPHYRLKNVLVPSLSEQERFNPTNELYLTAKKHTVNEVNEKLTPALQYIFANLYFAGGRCYLFDDSKEWYSWAGGFKEYLKRKYNLKITNGKSRLVSDDEATELNNIEYDAINSLYDYSSIRFQKCSTPTAYNKYKNGWLSGAKKQQEIAFSLAIQKKSSGLKTHKIQGLKEPTFFDKNKKIIIGIGISIIIAIIAYLIYRYFRKKSKK